MKVTYTINLLNFCLSKCCVLHSNQRFSLSNICSIWYLIANYVCVIVAWVMYIWVCECCTCYVNNTVGKLWIKLWHSPKHSHLYNIVNSINLNSIKMLKLGLKWSKKGPMGWLSPSQRKVFYMGAYPTAWYDYD